MSHKSMAFVFMAGLALMGAGCATSSPASVSGQPPVAKKTVSNTCSSPYYPLHDGYAVTYRINANGNPSSYTLSATTLSATKVKLKANFGSIVTEQILNCADGHLTAEGFLDIASATQGKNIKTETKKMSGEVAPKDMKVGTEWETGYEISIKGTDIGDTSSKIISKNKVVSEESVTVPAGTFTALKVSTVTDMVMEIPELGSFPVNGLTSTSWYVKDVGMVKSVTHGLSAGEGDTSVTEATKVSKP
ncbi:MAG: hypothetical protein Q8R07_04670 [Candidatus Uhrbacteria bacterium]|nr:hypothetical protein [Candidatus Uhrbacteria bacterium]